MKVICKNNELREGSFEEARVELCYDVRCQNGAKKSRK